MEVPYSNCDGLTQVSGSDSAGRTRISLRRRSRTSQVIVPTISISKVFKRILQQRSEGEALQAIAVLTQGQEVELDTTLALSAAKISAELGLPMADSVMLATARAYNATLWTQDAHFKDIEGVQYVEKMYGGGAGLKTPR